MPTAASTGIPGKTQPSNLGFTQSCPHPSAPEVVPVPEPRGGTSPLHGLDALQDKAGHRPPLPLAQRLQGAAENLIWKNQRALEHSWVTPKGCLVVGLGWGTGLGTSRSVLFPYRCDTGVAGGDGTCPSPSPRRQVGVGLGSPTLYPWLFPPTFQLGATPRGLSSTLSTHP